MRLILLAHLLILSIPLAILSACTDDSTKGAARYVPVEQYQEGHDIKQRPLVILRWVSSDTVRDECDLVQKSGCAIFYQNHIEVVMDETLSERASMTLLAHELNHVAHGPRHENGDAGIP